MNTHTYASFTKKESILLVLTLGFLYTLTPISIDMYLPLFDQIAFDFDARVADVQFSMTLYFLGVAFGQLLYGPMADRWGRRIPLYLGLGLGAAATILIIFSWSIPSLWVGRFLQALGFSCNMVIARTILADSFPPQQASRYLGYLIAMLSISPMFAPILGIIIAASSDAYGWRLIFFVILIFVALCLIFVRYTLPQTKPGNKDVKPLRAVQTYGHIFKGRNFLRYTSAFSFAASTLFVYLTFSSSVFVGHYGFSPEQFSIIFALIAVFMIVAVQVNGVLLQFFNIRYITIFSQLAAIISAGCFLLIALFWVLPYWLFLVFMALHSSFLGLMNPNLASLGVAGQGRNTASSVALMGAVQFAASTAFASIGAFLSSIHASLGMDLPTLFVAIVLGLLLLSMGSSYFLRPPKTQIDTL